MATVPEISLEAISPQRAREMLDLNTNNRRIQPEVVEYLAGCMERGEWVVNGEALKFLDSGTLGDGQHRLSAVVMSGVTIETLVVRGLPADALDSVDTQRARGVADALLVEGYERTVFLASAIKALHRFTGDDFTYGRAAAPSTDQALQLLEEAPELERSTLLASKVHRDLGFGPVGVLSTLHYLFVQVDPEAADDFFERLVSGVRLSSGDALLHLRGRFLKEARRPKPKRLKPPEVAHLTIVAFNHRRAGNEIEKLRARFSDPFPTILPKGAIERRSGGTHFRHHPSKIDGVVTIWDRVRAVVESSSTPMTAEAVVASLEPPVLRSTVSACLWRDAKCGRLQKVGRGLYASADYSKH